MFNRNIQELDYLMKLFKQYKEAKDVNPYITIEDDDFEIKDEFINYLADMKELSQKYLKYLDWLGIDYEDERTVEVGKGVLDSVVLHHGATIVTPFKDSFDQRPGKTFEGVTTIKDGDIEIVKGANRVEGVVSQPLEIPQGRIYITQNMYNPKCIKNWFTLSGRNDVAIGMFGSLDDANVTENIMHISSLLGVLDNVLYNCETDKDAYFCLLKTKGKQYEKILEKVR